MGMEPYQLVQDENYFRGILGNMKGPNANSKVRLGNRGNGHSPNYQVERDGKITRYSGLNHQIYHEDPTLPFEASHLSPGEFGYAEVQAMLKPLLKAK